MVGHVTRRADIRRRLSTRFGWPSAAPKRSNTALPELDLIRLVFRDPAVENAYQADTRDSYVRFLRLSIAVGIAVMGLYALLDTQVAGDALATVWRIRFGVMTPIAVAALALTWTPFFYHRPQLLITLLMQSIALGVAGIMLAIPSPGTSYYFSGLVTVMVFCCCVFRPHPRYAALNCALILAIYTGYVAFANRVAPTWIVNNLFYLAADGVTMVFATYLIELMIRRTYALQSVQSRLASFVSAAAVDAARPLGHGGDRPSQKVVTTILFADIRDFTRLAERTPPEEVIRFLNDMLNLQLDIIHRHGGDIDKMIGDAILARFDGTDGPARAIAAAKAIQKALDARGFTLGLGIGVTRGEVIAGTIGDGERQDHTIIGDAVNAAQRVCELAGPGEIVADANLTNAAFGPSETVAVKGRQASLTVRRWRGPDSPSRHASAGPVAAAGRTDAT